MSTAEAKERFPDWDRNTRAPVPLPPHNSCDCQVHIYEDPQKYPPKLKIAHHLPDGKFVDAQRVLRILGFDRAVLVHPGPYDTDYRLIIDILESLEDRSNYRGVVVVKDDATDKDLAHLDSLGVCGARFHIAKRYQVYGKGQFLRTVARVRELGWHIRLHFDADDLLEHSDLLKSIEDVPMVIDHMGRVDFSKGLDQPAMCWILDILKRDNWWMMVSNGNRTSSMESGWDDAIPFGNAYIAAAPDRMIWSTDWPHVRWRKARMMNDAEEVELFYRYVDNDAALIRKILVDNPARLHRFT